MRTIYNHIIIALTASLAMFGCEKYDLESTTEVERIISFASSVETTKATQTDNTALKIYGLFNIATFLTDDDNSHYYTDEVAYSDNVWASTATRYWPAAYNLNVYAYSPFSDYITINNATNYSDYSLTYSCPSDVTSQIDLLAKSLTQQTYDTDGINLIFQHILSGIKFKIEFESERNITLNSLDISYVGIECERTYNFNTSQWGDSESKYFLTQDANTTLSVEESKTSDSDSVIFDSELNEQLMIIPQPVSLTKDNPHYITVQIAYTLNGKQDGSINKVTTGFVPLPAPNSDSFYQMGYTYTYEMVVNDEIITFKNISITDQEEAETAAGNIDLGLITTRKYASDIGYTITSDDNDDSESSRNEEQYYYTVAERVKNLLLDGVRDFVVIGSLGADGKEHTLGDGKLGFYGDDTSPFSIGAELATAESGESYQFSVDLRGTYDYPYFQYANGDGQSTSSDIAADDPILTAGLFSDVKGLNEVILPKGLMAIGYHAFADCDALRSIDISEAKHIEEGAFQHSSCLEAVYNGELTRIHASSFDTCSILSTIDLSNVTHIDEFAFVNCEKLTNVNLSSISVVGNGAFNGCSELTFNKDMTSPKFTSIGTYAFSECASLGVNEIKIDLSETTVVGEHAFNMCDHIELSSGNLDAMTTIGNHAFDDCQNLGSGQEISMNAINTIGNFAFGGCTELNIISGLERLSTISSSAFKGCTSLTGYSAEGSSTTLSLPLVTSVGSYGFYKTGLTEVEFSLDKLTEIEEHAFAECESLKSISGLESVNSVGNNAFSSCTAMTELVLPMLTDGNWGRYFFSSCTAIEVLELPLLETNKIEWENADETTGSSSITDMINYQTVKEVSLPKLVCEIPGWGHFQNNTSLESVDFAAATSVEAGAFNGCTSLVTATLTAVKSVGAYAFQNCTSLKELSLPNLEDGNWAVAFFTGCNLQVISLPKLSNNTITWEETDADGNKTQSSASITDMINYKTIKEVSLPKLVCEIPGWSHFQANTSLESVNFAAATSVEAGAFYGCTSLKTAIISSATSVKEQAFKDCTDIETIDLSSATSVDDMAFYNCTALTELDLSSLPVDATIADDTFTNIPDNQCELWVSAALAATITGNTWQGVIWKEIKSK